LVNSIITHIEQSHELAHLLADCSARLPATFKLAIETMIAYRVAAIDNKSATLSFVVTTGRIETYPTAWSLFPFTRKMLK
jgi:hypothetical protein